MQFYSRQRRCLHAPVWAGWSLVCSCSNPHICETYQPGKHEKRSCVTSHSQVNVLIFYRFSIGPTCWFRQITAHIHMTTLVDLCDNKQSRQWHKQVHSEFSLVGIMHTINLLNIKVNSHIDSYMLVYVLTMLVYWALDQFDINRGSFNQ